MDLSHLIKETEAMLSSGAPTSSSSSSTAAPTASSDEGLSVEKTPPHLAQALDLVISQISSHDVQTSVSALKTVRKFSGGGGNVLKLIHVGFFYSCRNF